MIQRDAGDGEEQQDGEAHHREIRVEPARPVRGLALPERDVLRRRILFSGKLVVVKRRARNSILRGERDLIRRSVEIEFFLHDLMGAVLAAHFQIDSVLAGLDDVAGVILAIPFSEYLPGARVAAPMERKISLPSAMARMRSERYQDFISVRKRSS